MSDSNPPDNGNLSTAPLGNRLLWLAVFSAGVLVSLAWAYFMPRGFPITHPRFWSNTVFPLSAAAACLLGIVAVVRKQPRVVNCLVIGGAAMTLAAAITAKFLFPASTNGKLLAVLLLSSALALIFAWRVLKNRPTPRWPLVVCILAGALIGVMLPWSQRGMDAATLPYRNDPWTSSPQQKDDLPRKISLSDQIAVVPYDAVVRLDSGATELVVHPLLSFRSRSLDRCWTIFARHSERIGPEQDLIGLTRDAGGVLLDYSHDGPSRLEVAAPDANGSIRLEASTHLPHDVYSHLNSYCQIHLSGGGPLGLSFSPCPEVIEMMAFDYPVGRPARLAYLDADSEFHVVEATSGEKGPFRSLAQGKLQRSEPLAITIHSGDRAVYRITFVDWASQASTQLSPTAGWGLPENAIEFSVAGKSYGVIYITLAATSVGRGFDSVGHAAGTYRNRMTIEPIPAGDP